MRSNDTFNDTHKTIPKQEVVKMPLAQFLSTKKSIGNEELKLSQDRSRGRTTKDIPRLNQLTPDLY